MGLSSTAYFEYTGSGTLTVIGPFTGKLYRCDARGARVAVDHRDKGSILAIPSLKRVG